MTRSILMILALSLSIVSSIQAGQYGESVQFEDLHDQRTFSLSPEYDPSQSEGGLSGNWPYAFNISWNISYDLNALIWHYEYNLSVEKKDISHFILELTDTAQYDDITNIFIDGNPSAAEGPKLWANAGNQSIPNSFYGIKFDQGGSSVSYSFDTTRDPVWGNFYAKGGNDHGNLINVYNNALEKNNFYSDNKLDFIVRPDGGSSPPVVPEPLSSALFIAGGATLGLKRFRKKLNK